MLISPIFFGLSNVFSGILNSYKRFIAYALAPVVYNVAIISGAVFFAKYFGIYGLAYGVILGSFLHFAIQLPSVIKTGYHYRVVLDIFSSGVVRTVKLMIPTTIALAISQINLIVYNIIGSVLRSGSIAIINLANNIQTVPTVIFGISLATTVFPNLAEKASLNKTKEFVDEFSWSVRQILFLIIPSTAGIILLRAQIIRIVLGASKFTWADTQLASMVLGFFTLSLVAQSIIPILVRSFYALKDTKTPLLVAFLTAVVNVLAAIFLAKFFGFENGAAGLALAFSITSFLQFGILWLFLYRKLGFLNTGEILKSVLKVTLASFAMAVVIYGSLHVVSYLVNMEKFIGIFIQAFSAILIGVVFYLFFAICLKCPEASVVRRIFTKRKAPSS